MILMAADLVQTFVSVFIALVGVFVTVVLFFMKGSQADIKESIRETKNDIKRIFEKLDDLSPRVMTRDDCNKVNADCRALVAKDFRHLINKVCNHEHNEKGEVIIKAHGAEER